MRQFLISKLRWQAAFFILGNLAIGVYFVLRVGGYPLQDLPLLMVIIIGASPLLGEIVVKILRKEMGADVLAAISIIAAVLLGEYLACLLVMMMIAGGQALESYALGRASSVLRELASRMPHVARRKRGSFIEEINISDILINDIMVINPHDTCPADGVIIEGHGHMDESYLTGEPYRVAKAPGAAVISGATNGETVLIMKVLELPKESRYARIINVMAEAETKRPRLRRLSDQLGAIFAPIALLFAIGAWIVTKDPLRFLSVLVIATPCPLLIAIPVAIISAISLAARRGIIISDPLVLERLPTCKTAIFDKTGTLTYGKPILTKVIVGKGFFEKEILRMVASLEQYSKHPLSNAIIAAAQKEDLYPIEAKRVQEKPGAGLSGIVENLDIHIMGRKQAEKEFPDIEKLLPATVTGLECIVFIDGQFAACMQFRDLPRVESKDFVHHLVPFHAFKKVMLVSGDRKSEVEFLAQELGIKHILASQSPEQKLLTVIEETKHAPTLFMGDGINDAPALRAATVGIAFGKPTSATQTASGATVMESSLSKVDEVMHLSADMRKIALQSALLGTALSLIGMVIASIGFIPPSLGALLQQAIDALAILNAMRLTFKRHIKIDLPSQVIQA